MNILTGKIKRLTFSPTGFGRTEGDETEPHIEEIEWTRFLIGFLPQCKNMTEFRVQWKGVGAHTNFPLRTFAQQLADLCREFQLRVLDIDACRLMEPPNRPYVFKDEELCTANKHLSWINVPEPLPGHRSSDKLML
jgi:hypothetical protein